jgi:hypothetical protein
VLLVLKLTKAPPSAAVAAAVKVALPATVFFGGRTSCSAPSAAAAAATAERCRLLLLELLHGVAWQLRRTVLVSALQLAAACLLSSPALGHAHKACLKLAAQLGTNRCTKQLRRHDHIASDEGDDGNTAACRTSGPYYALAQPCAWLSRISDQLLFCFILAPAGSTYSPHPT